MYIEVVHDDQGNILACYCADTLPVKDGSPLVEFSNLPSGTEQSRINIDTITAMEIEEACSERAVINPGTGQPEIVKGPDRSEYVRQRFIVDKGRNLALGKSLRALPPGMAMRGLVKKL